ncbi:sigma factor-like helix-turn-helix DNA-binding protein [Gordonia sp. CPCC 205515]|uniref:sigma factor-like helix-turn-helix DNA-binding protein n=1 Tax=Gordonia sp. CPCC 205515 TaxID=3140791 RepID=UPI003AF3A5CC
MSRSSSEAIAATEAVVPDEREIAERLSGAELSARPWINQLPWLAEYQHGPPLLADDEIVVNAWIRSTPAETLTDVNLQRFCHRIAERYVADRCARRLADDFPHVGPGDEPLPLPRPALGTLRSNGVTTVADLLALSVIDLLGFPGIGPITVINLVARLVARSGVIQSDSPSNEPPTDDHADAGVFDDLAASLSEREHLILTDRILAARPRTQSELASMLGTSRERVTQIDRNLRRRLAEIVDATPDMRGIAEQLRRRANPVLDADTLITEFPHLGRVIDTLGVPAWRLLVAGEPTLTAVDDWIIHGKSSDAIAITRGIVESVATPEEVAPLAPIAAGLDLPSDATRNWLRRSGYSFLSEHVIASTASTGDLVAAVLSIAGSPQTFAEIVGALGDFGRAPSSVRNALVTDERIVKTDRQNYGLRRWGGRQYVPVHRQIDEILGAAAGPVPLATVIETITGTFDVSEASVRAYAGSGDFVIRDDMVMRRDRPRTPRKSPTRTRGLYREGSTTHWATTVTAAHLRGSAFNLPSALAGIVGIAPGHPVELATPLGPQSFMWVSVQARSGTIKRFATELGLTEGDPIFLDFTPESFDVRRVEIDDQAPSVAGILTLIGRPPRNRLSHSALLAALRESLWLPDDADPAAVVAALRHRKEIDLATRVSDVLL